MLDADLTSVTTFPVDAVRGFAVRIRIRAPVDKVTYGHVTAQLDRTGHGGGREFSWEGHPLRMSRGWRTGDYGRTESTSSVTGRTFFMVQQSPDDSTSGTAKGQGLRLGGGVIASLAGVGLLLIFMIQNTEDVTLNFLVWSFTWPLWLFSVVMALFGALVWFGLGVIRRHRRRKARRDDRRD
jgi:uncharacterized integral membrane protein